MTISKSAVRALYYSLPEEDKARLVACLRAQLRPAQKVRFQVQMAKVRRDNHAK